jgi:hypothetical protein
MDKDEFDEGMYKSSDIYGLPEEAKLQKEYQEYLTKWPDEIHQQQNSK